jgi:hypothetical protein
MNSFGRVSLVGMLLSALSACGSGNGDLRGQVRATIPFLCSAAKDIVGNRQLTVRDESGAVVATARTSGVEELTIDNPTAGPVPSWCQLSADYSMELPEAEFYIVELEGVPTATQPISREDLEERNLILSLEVAPNTATGFNDPSLDILG